MRDDPEPAGPGPEVPERKAPGRGIPGGDGPGSDGAGRGGPGDDGPGSDGTARDGARAWLARHRLPLSLEVDAPADDLERLLGATPRATVVGIGATTRSAHELAVVQQRLLRFLVERWGFRSLLIEEDWTLCLALDAYLRGADGDPRTLLAEARPFWRTAELLGALEWIRARNAEHPHDPVRLAGVNADTTRAVAYDVVAAGLARASSAAGSEAAALVEALRPTAGIGAHVRRLRADPDRALLAARARRLPTLVADAVPGADGELVVRHAHAIADFFAYHARDREQILRYATPRMAENVLWWQRRTGHRVVYWGGIAHTAAGTGLRLSRPPVAHRQMGSLLAARLGDDYLSVGLTFATGDCPQTVAPPGPELSEALLAEAGGPAYAIETAAGAGERHGDWLDAPARLRIVAPDDVPGRGDATVMSAGTLRGWFSYLVHVARVTPTTELESAAAGPGRPGR